MEDDLCADASITRPDSPQIKALRRLQAWSREVQDPIAQVSQAEMRDVSLTRRHRRTDVEQTHVSSAAAAQADDLPS